MGEFGHSLRLMRKLRKRTLQDVSDATHVSIGYLSQIESGARNPPSLEITQRIAAYLECDDEETEWFSIRASTTQREQAILNATRGYSPECVAACIEAVKASRDSDRHMERCAENQCKDCGPMAAHARKMYFDAIGLLSK